MKIHRTVNYDEKLKPDVAPGLAIFIRETEARELMMQMRAFWKNLAIGRQDPQGDTPFAQLYQQLKDALDG